jgi:HAD superfamily hydrolase (TIGR01509 family)
MIKGIIYDMDDLMVNSAPLHIIATDKILENFGHSVSELPDSLRSGFVGKRVNDVIKEITEFFELDIELNDFIERRYNFFLELIEDKLEPLPGLFESLDYFKKNNFKIALASSATRSYIITVLNKFNIREYFADITAGDEVRKAKPDPTIYLCACRKLKLYPKECVVLEDSGNGIQSAKAAGCKCIAIPSPYTPPQNHSEADVILDSLGKINLKIINSL